MLFRSEYIKDNTERLEFFRRFSLARTCGELETIADEMKDRFGKLPIEARRVVREHRLRIPAQQAKIPAIRLESGDVFGETRRLAVTFFERKMSELEPALRTVSKDIRVLNENTVSLGVPKSLLKDEQGLWEFAEKTLVSISDRLLAGQ